LDINVGASIASVIQFRFFAANAFNFVRRVPPMNELFAICRTFEIDEGQARGFVLMRAEECGEAKPWPILISRKANQLFGFENACPHHGTRLDTRPGEFLDEDGNFITCGKHRAQFDPDTGHCFIGPCQGQRLTPITLVIDDGDVCLTGVRLAEEDGLDIPDPEEIPEVMITGD
jgi:nitrite reductase/ring-hydroxylating ferredoxin subunit